MKVRHVIERLQSFSQDLDVRVANSACCGCREADVEVIKLRRIVHAGDPCKGGDTYESWVGLNTEDADPY